MTCPEAAELVRWRDGSLTASRSEVVEAHLESCASCAERLDAGTDDALEDELRARGERLRAPDIDPLAADEVDGYEIVEELHRGGQGVVFAATQRSTTRAVALKVLRHDGASRRQRSRFEREVQIVKRFQHPHIVPVFDQGETAHGRLFYVMELVRGRTLDAWAREGPSREERLELFLKVLDAVRYAHGRGVIHRDLKPGNIVVDEDGAPRVLDFGLARVVEGDEVATASLMTHTGEFVGTVAYASPEQVQGRPDAIDVRTDVYALGVVLYELVTGRLPYAMDGSLRAMLASVEEQEPERPSHVSADVGRDLETLLLTALAKDPERRYPTVDALARDLRAILTGDAILARPEGRLEQLARFARRHRALVASTAAIVVMLVAATAVSLHFAFAAGEARDEAEARARRAETIRASLQEVFTLASPEQLGRDVTLLDALASYERRLSDRFSDEPDVAASLWETVGATQDAFSEGQRALEAFRRAHAASVEAFGAAAPESLRREARLALHLVRVGSFDEAEAAIIRLEAGARDAPFLVRDTCRGARAELHMRRGEHLEAERVFREDVADTLTTLGEESAETQTARRALANVLVTRRLLDEAEQLLSGIEAWTERGDGTTTRLRLNVLGDRATIAMQRAHYADAERIYRTLLAETEEQLGESATAPIHSHLAIAVGNQGRADAAVHHFERAAALRSRSHGGGDQMTLTFRANLSTALVQVGRFQDGLDVAEEVAMHFHERGAYGGTAEQIAMQTMVHVFLEAGELEDARRISALAIERMTPLVAPDFAGLVSMRRYHAVALAALGLHAEAMAELSELIDVVDASFGEAHPYATALRGSYGAAALDAGALDVARPVLERTLEEKERLYGPLHAETKLTLDRLALLYEKTGDADALARAKERLATIAAQASKP